MNMKKVLLIAVGCQPREFLSEIQNWPHYMEGKERPKKQATIPGWCWWS